VLVKTPRQLSNVWAYLPVAIFLTSTLLLFAGCGGDVPSVRDIQRRRDQQRQAVSESDSVRDAFDLLQDYAKLQPEEAQRRIGSLLNAWAAANPFPDDWQEPRLLGTLSSQLRDFPANRQLAATRFVGADIEYLRLNFLLDRILEWMQIETAEDPLFVDWIGEQTDRLGTQGVADLLQASRLFDWTVRNIQLETLEAQGPGPQAPPLPAGLEFRGPGYRQTTFQTLYGGDGDALQRARVFIQLCRQSNIDACMLAHGSGAKPTEWAVGVRIGEELFLFEPALGLPIPGPDQIGITTLTEARENPSVLRRLNVPGWFDYPLDNKAIEKTIAMLDAPPESMSRRMRHLQAGLAGEQRLVLGYDVDAAAAALGKIPGIEEVRLWPLATESRLYEMVLTDLARTDQQILLWQAYQWGMLRGTYPLAIARWEHLCGNFSREGQDDGARIMYMAMRHPEFEIDDLRTNIDLQRSYGVRRELRMTEEQFDMQIQQVQTFMRLAKRAASYWISLLHYDLGDPKNAASWHQKRILQEDLESPWKSGARYNLARSLELLGEREQAAELYKTIGDPQEHGNRIRARLLENFAAEP